MSRKSRRKSAHRTAGGPRSRPRFDVIVAATLLHDVGKCYEYVDFVDDEMLLDPTQEYATEEIPHSLSGYALAHEVGCPLAVQRAIPHFIGEIPTRTLEAELVKSANSASSNAITQSTMGITLQEGLMVHPDDSLPRAMSPRRANLSAELVPRSPPIVTA